MIIYFPFFTLLIYFLFNVIKKLMGNKTILILVFVLCNLLMNEKCI